MSPPPSTTPALARGASRLAFDGMVQLTRVVEAMHANIAAAPLPLGTGTDGRTRGITRIVYDSVRLAASATGSVLDHGLRLLPLGARPAWSGARAHAIHSALNGVLGDYLAATENSLAIPMQLRRNGERLVLERKALAEALPEASGRVLLLVHGLCMNDRQWRRNGHDHGDALARDLHMIPLYLLYNSGRHVSENGRELAQMLEQLLDVWPVPVEEITVLAHSMGGLVARSALRHASSAGYTWMARVRKVVFLGTPHHGAPLERGGSWLEAMLGESPYTAPLARLGMLRSAGITDLRYGNVLDDDWRDRDRFARMGDQRGPAPLPTDVACYAVAARLGRGSFDARALVLGDGLVPVDSALGRHREPERALDFPESRCFVGHDMSHFDLLDRAEVYARLRAWLG